MKIKQFFKKFTFSTILALCILSYFTTANDCIEIKLLKDRQNHFMDCIMNNVTHDNFRMCITCADNYTDMMSKYNIVTTNCPQYIGDNPIDVIRTLTNDFTQIWEKAYCPDCFVDDKNTALVDLNAKFTSCYNNILYVKENKFCTECLPQYEALNSYYINIDLKNKGKVCYDLHYMVNVSRIKWSVCSKHEGNLFYFILSTSFVCCLPIIFYGVNILLTKRIERNHGVLYDRETEHRISNTLATPFPNATTTTTSSAIIEPIEETRVQEDDIERKADQLLIDIDNHVDSSSDDESLLPKKVF